MSESALHVAEGQHVEHHEHPKGLQHHFATFEQQLDATKIGMWLFLGTELLLFGGLFVGFGMMQSMHYDAFKESHHHLDKNLGFLNTVVLLISSWTAVMSVWAAQNGKRKALIRFLATTILLAGVFLVVKFFEYHHKFEEGLLPGVFYSHHGDHVGDLNGHRIFFSFYFMMTGLHGIHVVAGMAALGYILRRAVRGDFTLDYWGPVDIAALYWHLVDMIWIYLFPLLYLIS
jgi:cytochrome c oxidase subunit III